MNNLEIIMQLKMLQLKAIKEPIEIKSPENDKNTTDHQPNWFDRNKFEETLSIIDSNKFNPHMHKLRPGGPTLYIFDDQFYWKNARKLRFHVFLHFYARKHMI